MDQLASRLERRIESMVERADTAAVLDPAAIGEVEELGPMLLHSIEQPDSAEPMLYLLDSRIVALIADLYYLRCAATKVETPQTLFEVQRAVALYALIAQHLPEQVPEDVRPIVAAAPPPPSRDVYSLGIRSIERFERWTATGDRTALEESIALVREILGVTPATHIGRPTLLANLSGALRDHRVFTGSAQELDEAVLLGRAALHQSTPDHPDRLVMLSNLCSALTLRHLERGRRADLDEAAALGTACLTAGSRPHPMIAFSAALALLARYNADAVPDDLDLALSALRDGVARSEPGTVAMALCRSHLGVALLYRHRRDRDPADLAAAEREAAAALEDLPTGHPEHLRLRSNLSAVTTAASSGAEPADRLDAAVAAAEADLASTDTTGPRHDLAVFQLGTALRTRYKRLGSPADADRAETLGAIALAETKAVAFHIGWRDLLADVKTEQAQRSGERSDFDAAVASARAALESAFGDEQQRGVALARLGHVLDRRHALFASPQDGEEAVRSLELARERLDGRHRDALLMCLRALRSAHRNRALRTLRLDHLDEAIDAARAAHAVDPDASSSADAALRIGELFLIRFRSSAEGVDLDRSLASLRDAAALPGGDGFDVRFELATALMVAFEWHGRPDFLREAIDLLEALHAHSGLSDVERARLSSRHSFTLVVQSETARSADGARRSVDLARQALALTPPGHPFREPHLNNLGLALAAQYRHSGSAAVLDEAIRTAREARDIADPADPVQVSRGAGNLGTVLRLRWGQMHSAADLAEAIDLHREAAVAAPQTARHRVNLSIALAERFSLSEAQSDIDEAVDAAREGRALTPSDAPQRIRSQIALAAALRIRNSSPHRRHGDTDEAVAILSEAVRDTPEGHPSLAIVHSNLSVAFSTRSIEDPVHPRDASRAVKAAEQALRMLPADHPERARTLGNLGTALLGRARAWNADKSLDRGIACFREATRTPSAPAQTRFRIAGAWSRLALELARSGRLGWDQALEAHQAVIAELPNIAWRGLDREARLSSLGRISGLSSDAAAVALNAGEPETALRLLELGRGLLLADAIDARDDLADLRERRPDLAARIRDLRALLDAEPDPGDFGDSDPSPGDQARRGRAEAERRRGLTHDLDDLVRQVRALPGLEDFQRPPSIERLQAAAAGGPVVVVNTSALRCDAIIVTRDRILPVPLRDLHLAGPEGIEARSDALLPALERIGRSIAETWTAQIRMADTLAWLWRTIAEPVLGSLEPSTCAGGDRPSRMWWCPTGLLTLLPLHAAGRYGPEDGPDENLHSRFVCSYTSTVRALAAMRGHEVEPGAKDRLLAIAQPATPGLSPLPRAQDEIANLAGRATSMTRLDGPAALRAEVLTALPHHSMLHFAGHGSQQWSDLGGGALYTHDHQDAGPLTAADIARLRLRRARLAYLSACETARGTAELPDEALHLSGALQIAGFTHVVAAQWKVQDQDALDISDGFYAGLGTREGLDPDRAARALHQAVANLRAQSPEPIWWAAYVHTGP
ncbi:CHAT domain-containing protein [Glycomyces endophyticus]|uniref:CHAT domain-containing protein n=1 Tax=Glycomyces endophyticus TaxID=480996 RepID=UPI0031E15EA5